VRRWIGRERLIPHSSSIWIHEEKFGCRKTIDVFLSMDWRKGEERENQDGSIANNWAISSGSSSNLFTLSPPLARKISIT